MRTDTQSVVSNADEILVLSSRITNTLNTLEVFDHDTVTELIVRADLMYITKVLYTMINANYWNTKISCVEFEYYLFDSLIVCL